MPAGYSRYRVFGKLREIGLGPLHTIGLADARVRAQECRRQRLDGLDPIETRKAARMAAQLEITTAITFKDAARRYMKISYLPILAPTRE